MDTWDKPNHRYRVRREQREEIRSAHAVCENNGWDEKGALYVLCGERIQLSFVSTQILVRRCWYKSVREYCSHTQARMPP